MSAPTDASRGLPDASPGSYAADRDLVAPAFASAAGFWLAPVTAASWRALAQVVVAFVWLLPAGIVVVVLVSVSVGLVPALGVGVPLLGLSLMGTRGIAAAERARLAAQCGTRIARPFYRPSRRPGWWRPTTWWAVATDGRTWAHVLYAFVGMLVACLAFALTIGLGSGAVAALAFPLYGRGTNVAGWFDAPYPVVATAAALVGVVLAWMSCLAAQGAALRHVRMARAMLGPSERDAALAAARAARRAAAAAEGRAVTLTETRTRAVDAANAERRRIERDLHDGAQQRLVALGVELGTARRAAARDPQSAVAALDHAHREVKETLAELRDLVRGIHPAVLTDRGLDAALSALAARSPVPVTVVVPDAASLGRAAPGAQAAAYFVVAEALTNVAKHAEARAARVEASVVLPDGDGAVARLRVVVTDDGRGGARSAPGSGLDGLRSRVAALDGAVDLTSPEGRGTRLTVELPCAS
ncbi:sensor domain-containing protein [Cellulomonas sp. PhB143]|uniref:sensor histidine kinase n=1 Tax=Cellulomonas sp. PhB143 TaxID=2485186 RepID=UPI000F4885C2|nr:sensor domain-containing protein [Cellulomonas sp. PhB143]ROS75346.1 signal transduction histidine kinase [Cellulomonas sp. PhB143]